MKPESWDKMSKEEKTAYAHELLRSQRGAYIMAQALSEAIRAMSRKPVERREVSNIQDMQILLEGLFPVFGVMFELQRSPSFKRQLKSLAKRAAQGKEL
jgi:hypothetical protein